VLTNWMDASVIDETDPTKTDPALDPFNPENGPPYRKHSLRNIALRNGRVTSASPIGRRRNWRGSRQPEFPIESSHCFEPGRICVSWIRHRSFGTPLPGLLCRPAAVRQP